MSEEIVIPEWEERRRFLLIDPRNVAAVEIRRWKDPLWSKADGHVEGFGPYRWSMYALINSSVNYLFNLDCRAFPLHGCCTIDRTETKKCLWPLSEYALRRVGCEYGHSCDKYISHLEDIPEVVKRDAEILYEFLQRNMDGPEPSRRITNHA